MTLTKPCDLCLQNLSLLSALDLKLLGPECYTCSQVTVSVGEPCRPQLTCPIILKYPLLLQISKSHVITIYQIPLGPLNSPNFYKPFQTLKKFLCPEFKQLGRCYSINEYVSYSRNSCINISSGVVWCVPVVAQDACFLQCSQGTSTAAATPALRVNG